MQAARMSTLRTKSRQKSCTECRRRRQKCNSRPDGPCGHCARRYPPVECIMPEHVEKTSRKPKIETQINFSETESQGSSSKSKLPAINERPYVSPYPILSEKKPSKQVTRLESIFRFDNEAPLSSSSSSSASVIMDSDSYFETSSSTKKEQSHDIPPASDSILVVEGTFSGSPRPVGGILAAISSLNSLPIKPTARNAELFYFFHQFVIPNLVSLDGGGTIPALFLQEMLPWMIQSPLMPNIAILMASYTQAQENTLEVRKYSETLSIKAHVLSLINNFLRQDFDIVGGEALRAVIHLVILEWFWGSEVSLWAHMKGLRQMIKLRGGFEGMRDPLLVQVLILTDYEIACCFERELYLQPPPSENEDERIPTLYPARFSSPLVAFPTSFRENRGILNLTVESAEILDDMRLLCLSLTSERPSRSSTFRIQKTASRLHEELQVLRAASISMHNIDFIFTTIVAAALMYSSCIMSLAPFGNPQNKQLLDELYSNLSQISLTRWKEMPGIFLWILLIGAPNTENDAQGKFLKKKMAVAGMSIGLEDFNLATGQLRACWKVQRWIADARQQVEEVIS